LTPTLATALQQAKSAGVERLDAQLMLAHLVGQSRTWVIAHSDASLPEGITLSWKSMLQRRSAGEPLAYLLGEKEFHGLTLQVTPDVLVPRPDTETLVEWALEHLDRLSPTAAVVDLGTGSGAVALALQHAKPQAAIWAIDASEAALNVARTNAAQLGLPVQFRQSHWWQALGSQRFELVVSNPPYIAEGDPHLLALSFEPRQALTSGPEGLDDLRSIIQDAPDHLEPGAWLLLEHGYDQAKQVQALLADSGFDPIQTRLDAAGVARCTGGRWPKRDISDISD
jgi:release factor glutamine methyltransferase